METIIIRKMLPGDISQVVLLMRKNFPTLPRVHSLEVKTELDDMFSNATYRPTFFVAEREGQILGLGGWNWSWCQYDHFELLWGQVVDTLRGQGIGRLLVQARLDDILDTCEGSVATILLSTHHKQLYEHFGFTSLRCYPTWQSPETHLMLRELRK